MRCFRRAWPAIFNNHSACIDSKSLRYRDCTPREAGVFSAGGCYLESAMIAHCVFLNLSPTTDRADCQAVLDTLCVFARGLPGVSLAQAGVNLDLEAKSPDHPMGFVIHFVDRAALEAYAELPEHKALGAQLVALCVGGADGIMVYDLEFNTPDP